jgi:hypothetical protein
LQISPLKGHRFFHCSLYSHWFAQGSYPSNSHPYIHTSFFCAQVSLRFLRLRQHIPLICQ